MPVALSALCPLPLIIEVATQAIGRRLSNHNGIGKLRHRLEKAGQKILECWEISHLREVHKLEGELSTDTGSAAHGTPSIHS